MLLLFLFGYALTLDVDRVPLAVWDQSATPVNRTQQQALMSAFFFIFPAILGFAVSRFRKTLP